MSIILILGAILLVLVVLLQPGKGGGLTGGTFGGVAGQFNTMFGARRTTDFLQKFTIGLALGIIFLTVITNKFFLSDMAVSQRAPVTVGGSAPAMPPSTPKAAPAQQQPSQQQAPVQQQAAPAQQQPAQQQPAQQQGR